MCACCLWCKCTLSLLTDGASPQAQAYAVNANFSGASRHMCAASVLSPLNHEHPRNYNRQRAGADMTNAVLDRVSFDGANLTNVKFVNAVITGSTFKGADLSGSVFEDALIGNEDAKRL